MAEQASGSAAGAGSIGEQFLATSRLLRRGFVTALEPLGITPHEARALRVIRLHGPVRLGVLAETLRVVPRSVTDVVDALETSGLIVRAPDPLDRRATVVEVTSRGESLAQEVEAARRRQADSFFAGLSATDRAELTRLLDLLAADSGPPPEWRAEAGSGQ